MAGEAGELQSFFAGTGELVEKAADLVESVADCVGEGALEVGAEGVPVGVVAENEGLHPAVALGEHFYELIFQILPVVVAPVEERFDGCGDGGARAGYFFEGAAGGAAVEVVGLLGDGKAAAEAGEERLLEGQFAAEGVDGGDAELGGQVEELPAEGVGVVEGAAGEGGVGVRRLRQFVEDAVAHFGGGGVGEGDGDDLAGVVDFGQQGEEALA